MSGPARGAQTLGPDGLNQAWGAVIDRLLHASAREGRDRRRSHARFIGVRVAMACLGCAILPAYALMSGAMSGLELTAFMTIGALLLPAALVSATGRLQLGQDLSAVLFCAAIAAIAIQSGGTSSAALALFAIVLLDPAFSGSRVALQRAVPIAVAAFGIIAAAPVKGPASALSPLAVSLVVMTYAVALAWALVERSERKASSEQRQKARADAALDAVTDVVLWREPNGEVSFANAAAHQTLGLDRRELSEQAIFERINVGDRPAFLKALSDARIGSGEGHALIRIAAERAEGRVIRVFEMSARPVADDGEAIIVVLRDVTERHAADQMREAARHDAERIANSKSSFIATMSHELRTPLNAIIGFSDLLLQDGLIPAGDARREEYARIINGSGQHLLEIVNAILDMSKIESGMMTVEQERVDVVRVIETSRQLLSVKAGEKNVQLEVEIAADLPEIIADRRALKQIVINLISNAVKFTPSEGEVAVTAVRDRDHVEIAVMDTGCGISEDDMKRLGSPFFQARQAYDRQHEGTGLGLSVVRGLVGLMGGTMLLESAVGEGTRVVIRLPCAGLQAGTGAEPVQIATRIRARRGQLESRLLQGAPPDDEIRAGDPLRKTA